MYVNYILRVVRSLWDEVFQLIEFITCHIKEIKYVNTVAG